MCYRYVELRLGPRGKGLFEGAVDATYVLMMEGSSREAKAIQQLREFVPQSTVRIQYNKGFKKCTKPDWVKQTYNDLAHAYATAFEHAMARGYKKVLVLEDDFIFDKNNIYHDAPHIAKFLRERDDWDSYNMGSLFSFSVPWGTHRRILGVSSPTHAVVYNERYMKQFLKDVTDMDHVDAYYNGLQMRMYCYYTPAVFQTFPETANQKTWKVDPNFSKMIMQTSGLAYRHDNYRSMYHGMQALFWGLLGVLFVIVVVLAVMAAVRVGR